MVMMTLTLPHLLVDGANVLHAWPDLRALLRRNPDAARTRLVQMLAVLHDTEERRVTVVFDGRGPDLVIDRPSGHVTFSVLTTPSGSTADDVIEQLVANSEAAACVVATADRAVRETVEAAGGASIDPGELAAWVARAEQRSARAIARLRVQPPEPREPS